MWNAFNEVLEEKCGSWKKILNKAIEKGVDRALATLEAARKEIVKVCRENNKLLQQLIKFTTKTCLGAVATKQNLKLAAEATVNAAT